MLFGGIEESTSFRRRTSKSERRIASKKPVDKTRSFWINQIKIPSIVEQRVKCHQAKLKKPDDHSEMLEQIGLGDLSEILKSKLSKGLTLGEAFDQGFVTENDRTLLENYWFEQRKPKNFREFLQLLSKSR